MHPLANIPWEQLLQPPGIYGILGICVPIVAIVAHAWRRAFEAKLNARLKQSMIERGFSADEIERVIHAGESDELRGRRPGWWQQNAGC